MPVSFTVILCSPAAVVFNAYHRCRIFSCLLLSDCKQFSHREIEANSHRMRFDAYACVARQKRMRMRNLRRGIRILV